MMVILTETDVDVEMRHEGYSHMISILLLYLSVHPFMVHRIRL